MKQQFKILQKQKLTTKQIQSVEILKLSQSDLDSFIEECLVDNPFSDVEEHEISFELKDVDYKVVNKNNESNSNNDYADESENDLISFVLPQLYEFIKTKKDREIFVTILESLDSRGFLVVDTNILEKTFNIAHDKLNSYIDLVKNVEPKGLATKNVKDCILYQLSQIKNSELAVQIVNKNKQ